MLDLALASADHYPIWGTCYGFQELAYLTNGEDLTTLSNCWSEGVALPLNVREKNCLPFQSLVAY